MADNCALCIACPWWVASWVALGSISSRYRARLAQVAGLPCRARLVLAWCWCSGAGGFGIGVPVSKPDRATPTMPPEPPRDTRSLVIITVLSGARRYFLRQEEARLKGSLSDGYGRQTGSKKPERLRWTL